MKKVLYVLFVLVVAAASGCASAGYTGFTGMSVPGYEAVGVMAGHRAMIASIVGQQGWAPYGQYGNVPVCRAQDLVGLPPVSVSQPVLVRVSKSKGHQTKDVVGAAAIGAGLGYLNSGSAKAVAIGAGAGAGGGLLVANHEQELCLLLPVKTP